VVYDCLIYLSFNAGLLLAWSANPKVAEWKLELAFFVRQLAAVVGGYVRPPARVYVPGQVTGEANRTTRFRLKQLPRKSHTPLPRGERSVIALRGTS